MTNTWFWAEAKKEDVAWLTKEKKKAFKHFDLHDQKTGYAGWVQIHRDGKIEFGETTK